MYWVRSFVNIPNSWRAKFLHWVFFHSNDLSWKCVFIRWKTDKKRIPVFFFLYKKLPRSHHILYSFVCLCVFPSLWGGRDEQEGLAAVRRICEHYKEAKGNIANIKRMHTQADTRMRMHKCCCFSKLLFEDKGKSCCSLPRRLFSSLYQTYTRFHSCR